MESNHIYASDLSSSRHSFHQYHFCRGNSSKRKSRLGVILKGSGTYIYLGKRLKVAAGDAVFIPEHIYCYSEWHGEPDIEVLYLSCFLHYESFVYEPQIIKISEEEKSDILQISDLLSCDEIGQLEAYSRFYRLLITVLPQMKPSTLTVDKTLQTAIEYVTEHWDQPFSVSMLARHCCVSESTLYHLFQKELGQTPVSFLQSIRINVAIEHLENTDYSIATISHMVGFHSENHFRRVFSALTGMTPLKLRKKGSTASKHTLSKIRTA